MPVVKSMDSGARLSLNLSSSTYMCVALGKLLNFILLIYKMDGSGVGVEENNNSSYLITK